MGKPHQHGKVLQVRESSTSMEKFNKYGKVPSE